MLISAIAAGVAIGLAWRGRGVYGPPRATALVVGAAGTQVASQYVSGRLHSTAIVLSLALAASWLAVQRRHVPSVLLGLGACLNLAVIAANGGMPVDAAALEAVGRTGVDVTNGFLYKHVPMDGGTRLRWLADRIPIPVQRNVISVGDVLMAIAIMLWVADSVREWRAARGSTGAVDGEHGGSPCSEVIGLR